MPGLVGPAVSPLMSGVLSLEDGCEEGFAFFGGEIVDHHLAVWWQRPRALEKLLNGELEALGDRVVRVMLGGRHLASQCTTRPPC